MALDVRMNYPSMQKMAQTFTQAAASMGEMQNVVKQLSQMMEQGALVGDAGTAFREKLNGPLTSRLKAMQEKFTELSKDIKEAETATKEGVTNAKSRFAN